MIKIMKAKNITHFENSLTITLFAGKCGPGKYYNRRNNICTKCGSGMYNPDDIAEKCKPCDVFHTTTGETSVAVSDCKRKDYNKHTNDISKYKCLLQNGVTCSDKINYRSGTVNSNTVNSKFHLIRSYYEIFFYHFSNISCLKCTVNSNFHLIRSKTLPTNDFELTVPNLYNEIQKLK